jgi:hypothetical protein
MTNCLIFCVVNDEYDLGTTSTSTTSTSTSTTSSIPLREYAPKGSRLYRFHRNESSVQSSIITVMDSIVAYFSALHEVNVRGSRLLDRFSSPDFPDGI